MSELSDTAPIIGLNVALITQLFFEMSDMSELYPTICQTPLIVLRHRVNQGD